MKKPPTHKLVHGLAYAALTFCALSLVFVVYLMIFPLQHGSVTKFVANKTVVRQGEEITFTIDFCTDGGYRAITTRSIVSEKRVTFLPSIETQSKQGCYYGYKFNVLIPEDYPTGKAHIETDSTDFLNPIHERHSHHDSPTFTVIEGNKPGT